MYLCVCIYIDFLLINSHPGVSRPSLLWAWSQCTSLSMACATNQPSHGGTSSALECWAALCRHTKGSVLLFCKAINLSSEDFIEK